MTAQIIHQAEDMYFMVQQVDGTRKDLRSIRLFEESGVQYAVACDHENIKDAFRQSLSLKKKLKGINELEQKLLSILAELDILETVEEGKE